MLGAALRPSDPTGCGYHVAGHADLMPKTIKTIAMPAFAQRHHRYKLARPAAPRMSRANSSRAPATDRRRPEAGGCRATGPWSTSSAYPIIFDPVTGRATGVQAIVTCRSR